MTPLVHSSLLLLSSLLNSLTSEATTKAEHDLSGQLRGLI